MSSANLDFVRAGIERFNDQGPAALDTVFHPDTIGVPFREWPEQSLYAGADGVAKLAGQWMEQFDHYRWDVKHLLEAGDAVVALVVHGGVARGSGMGTSAPIGAVFSDFRDGLVARVHFFLTWEEALEHAGLPPDQVDRADA